MSSRPDSGLRLLSVLVIGLVASLAFGACGKAESPDQAYARGVMKETYRWIRDYVNPATGLPYDNHTKGEFTSVTNIGLYVAAVATAEKLGMEERAEALRRIEACLAAVEKFQTYKGWAQSWNSVVNGSPSSGDPIVSTLDSGNYWAGWIVARQAFPELSERISRHLETMNWADLYDAPKGYLYGGYNRKTNAFSGGWYLDMIGTDARLAVFFAVATGAAPSAAWTNLKRPLISHNDLSYYEPGWMGGGLFMQVLSGIFLDERATPVGRAAADFAYAQMLLGQSLKSPAWGWSASDSPKDGYCGWGTLRRNIITPHASALASLYYPQQGLANLRSLESMGARAPIAVDGETRAYGFRDAIDWTTKDVTHNYLVLDQAMLFLSLANSFEDGTVWKLFNADPLVQKGLAAIPELSTPQPEHLALYTQRDAAPPAAPASTVSGDTLVVIDDFTGRSVAQNLLGGMAEAWSRDKNDPTQGCRASIVAAGGGRRGKALALDYDVESPQGAWCGYRTNANGANAAGANALVLDLRADERIGNPGAMKIELSGPAGAATYMLRGIETEWKRHVIPLAGMQGMNIEWSKVGPLVFVFEDARVSGKVGRLLVGRIALERVADSELAPSGASGGAVTGLAESFDDAVGFNTSQWEGATIRTRAVAGRTKKALEISYDLAQTKQWVQVLKTVSWRMPARFGLTFDIFWTGKKNLVELKFVDGDGSVFGFKLSDPPAAGGWRTVTVPPERVQYFWGGDRTLSDVVQFGVAISSAQTEGGRGVVRIDNLRVTPAGT